MFNLRACVAVLTVCFMLPGAGELAENVIHLVKNGHTAHALDDENHARQGTEHGCSGTAHVCSCCQSPAFLSAKVLTTISSNTVASWTRALEVDDLPADGYLTSVFRPPIA